MQRSGFSLGFTLKQEHAMKPLITSALIVASLTLAGNGAMAADTYAKTGAPAASAHTAVHAARHRYPVARYAVARPPVDVAQIIGSLFASPWLAPYVARYGGKIRTTRGSSGGTYEPYDPPTYDTSSPPDNSVQQSLDAQAEAQSLQQMNDTSAMTASMAAAAAQAAANDAAETQQIMNNGGL
jgi:hypothetical protein